MPRLAKKLIIRLPWQHNFQTEGFTLEKVLKIAKNGWPNLLDSKGQKRTP